MNLTALTRVTHSTTLVHKIQLNLDKNNNAIWKKNALLSYFYKEWSHCMVWSTDEKLESHLQ